MNVAHATLADEPQLGLPDYLAILERRRGLILWTSGIVLLVAAALALGLPPVYRSTATILIEQQEIPPELVRSTVTTFADQRLQVIRQRVMTTANLVEIIKKYDLYPDDRGRLPIEQIVADMADDITMETVSAEVIDPQTGKPGQATIAFTVGYEYGSPDVAQRVANELTSLYLNENLKTRALLTTETSEFLDDEADKLKSRVAELEGRLATFKETHADSLPELSSLNLQLMDRAERELFEAERQMRALQERKIYLTGQLATLEPTVPAPVRPSLVTDRGERLLEARDRLKVLRSQYLTASARYSASHPDVVRLRSEIKALEAEVGEPGGVTMLEERVSSLAGALAAARDRYSEEHPDVRRLDRELEAARAELAAAPPPAAGRKRLDDDELDNPAYVQIKAQIQAADAELRALRRKEADLEAKIGSFEARLAAAPQVEREYKSLVRDYENAALKYQEVRAKQMEAQIAQSLETEQKGERFTLIEPPLLPEEPTSPNRLAILALGFVLALGSGFGASAASEAMDDRVHGRRAVGNLLGQAPLAVLPHITTPGEARKRLMRRAAVILGILLLAAAAALAVHQLVMPLDVLWFAAMRRLGIFL